MSRFRIADAACFTVFVCLWLIDGCGRVNFEGIEQVHLGSHIDGGTCSDPPPIGEGPSVATLSCLAPLNEAPGATHAEGDNRWLDEFNGAGASQLGVYPTSTFGVGDEVLHARLDDHWVSDIRTPAAPFVGAVLHVPKAFNTENGTIVVEWDIAHLDQEVADMWSEVVIAGASRLTENRGGPFVEHQFGGVETFACRMLDPSAAPAMQGVTIQCSYHTASDDRLFESNWFGVSDAPDATVFGGMGSDALSGVCKICSEGEGYSSCLNRYRLELQPTSLSLFINGVLYHSASNLPSMDALLGSPWYVHFGSVVYRHSEPGVFRTHWDRIAVNP